MFRKPRHWRLAILFVLFLPIHCSRETNVQKSLDNPVPSGTCGQAQTEAFRLVQKADYEAALRRYHDSLSLCGDSAGSLQRSQFRITDIGRAAPAQCPRVLELFREVPPSERIDYLQNSLAVHSFCSSDNLAPYLDHLVEAESRETYGAEGSLFHDLVEEYENARLSRWAKKPELHLQHLKSATRALCRGDILPEAIRSLEKGNGTEQTPVSGTLGLWILQPAASIDKETRSCLAAAAARMQASLPRFHPEFQRQANECLTGVRSCPIDGACAESQIKCLPRRQASARGIFRSRQRNRV